MTVAENKDALEKQANEIEDMKTKIQQLTTKIEEQKAEIQSLTKKPTVSKQYFQMKPPIAYKCSDQGSFYAYARKLLTYFKAMNVEPEDQASLLLTFLAAEEFEMVTRIYAVEIFSKEEETTFDKAVEMINDVLQHDMTQAGAMSRLQQIRQNDKSVTQFIAEIERLGRRAYPQRAMEEARDRACIAALQINCRSKVLSMEIYRAVKQAEQQKHNATFSEISKLAIEMDALLVERSDPENECENIQVFNVNHGGAPQQRFGSSRNNGIKRCFTCGSSTHLARNCPSNYYESDEQGFFPRAGEETHYDDDDYNNDADNYEENCDNYDDGFQPHEEMGRYGTDTDEQSERGHIANNSHGQIQSDNRNWNEDNGNIRRINTIRSVGQDEEICEN